MIAVLPASSRSPNTSSVNDVNVTDSTDVLATSTEKVTVPPGSLTEPGTAVFVTEIVGRTSLKPTVASSSSVAVLPSPSSTTAVTVSTWSGSPKSPATKASNEHEKVPATAIVVGCDGHVFADTAVFPASNRSPNTSSVNEVRVSASPDVFVTSTENVTVAPGSGTVEGEASFVTVMPGLASPKTTVASSSSVAVLPSSSSAVAVTVFT